MNVFLWILQVLLALAFGMAGVLKTTQPKEKLAANMGWVEDYSAGMVKFIGAVEFLAALGLILPAVTGIATFLTPLAATGLALIMIGAIVVHVKRNEIQSVVVNVVLLILSALVAWGRFGPYHF
ncbi:DoxX family protein [Sphaerisporangium sp. NPDC088356]|uniref:DoxX family protein n=1 Tax=Sphaerisporangium sp. NPDC088356 TaxID=3154871 RepID=UPI00343DE809